MDLFINHQWQKGNGNSFISIDPGTEEMIWSGNYGSVSDVDRAFQAAHKAQPAWGKLPFESRFHYLERFRSLLKENFLPLAVTISRETGKPLWDSKSEVEGMIQKIEISYKAYQNRSGFSSIELPLGQLQTLHKPHGVLAVFGPYNFPGHLPNGHIIPALLAGNTIVFKPSELTPLVAIEMVKIWEKCQLPPGVINLVLGEKEIGQAIASHPLLNGLLFTGSYKTGQLLLKKFAENPEKIIAVEMGGNNPLVIGNISQLDAAVLLIIRSAFISSGQRCTCSRRLIIPETSYRDDLIQKLIKGIQSLKIGHFTAEPEPFMGPLINKATADKMLQAQEKLNTMGGKILVEMQRKNGSFITPGLMDVTEIEQLPDEEYFGPFLQYLRVKNLEEAIQKSNQTAYGLIAGIFSEDENEFHQFYTDVKAGIINWNTPLTGASSQAPFGGIGQSGNFRPSGFYAADYCSYPVASMIRKELKAQPFPGIYSNGD